MSEQLPEAGEPSEPGNEVGPETVVVPSVGARLALIVAVALVLLLVWIALLLNPELVRDWSNASGNWRLFGGSTPSL